MSKPYSQPGEKGTDTNQANKELRLHIHAFKINSLGLVVQRNDGEYSQAEYICESAELEENLLSSIQAIIRTEKLKLLAEVREQVIGKDEPGITNIMIAAEHAEQMSALNKLEAELKEMK